MTNEQFIIKVLSIAKIGKKYSKDPYALESYNELEELSVKMLNSVAVNEVSRNIFVSDLYPTPNLSVRVLIVNQKSEVLFVKEVSDSKWGVPGGWCDLFISPRANAEKEVFEEVGLRLKTKRLLAVFNREKYRKPKTILSDYVMYFYAEMDEDQKVNIGFEVSDYKFAKIEEVVDLSTNNTREELNLAWDILINNKECHVDWKEKVWKLM